jgi:hypothetical protein
MARTGLTNFVAWAIATLCVGYFLVPRPSLLLVAGVSLGVALFARFWPEALGVAGGVAAIFLFDGAWSPVFLLAAGAIGVSTLVIWRQRATLATAAAPAPAPPADVSSPRRLTFTTLVATFGVFVLNFVVSIGFGLSCDADARPGAPGSDRAAWCDALSNHHAWAVILSVPSAVVFLGGIYAASRGRAREVMMWVVAGFALVIAVHVPDVVL